MSVYRTLGKVRFPHVFVVLFLLAFTGIITHWFLQNFEKKEFQYIKDISPAARKNRLLAAERFLSATGKIAISQKGMALLRELPPATDAIVVRRMSEGLSNSINENIFSWVEAGGHLMFVPNSFRSNHPGSDDLLERLGADFVDDDQTDCGCPPESEATVEHEGGSSEADDSNEADDSVETEESDYSYLTRPHDRLLKINLDGIDLQLNTSAPRLLEDNNEAATLRLDGSYTLSFTKKEDFNRAEQGRLIERQGAWLLQYRIGEGKITLLSEIQPFYNSNIGQFDHAALFDWLLQDASTIWLLHDADGDSIFAVIWNRLPYFCVSLLVLILLVLWRMQKRSGSYLYLQDNSSSNIMEHIDASGRYGWGMDKLALVIEENRKNILRLWAARSLGVCPDGKTEKIDLKKLSRKSGVASGAVHDAFVHEVKNEQDLIRTSKALLYIQKVLFGGEQARNE